MISYIIRRMMVGVLTVWVISLLVFGIFFAMPGVGDPAYRMAGKNPTPDMVAQIRKEWCFDKPIPVTYVCHMKKLFTGKYISPSMRVDVVPLAMKALPVTFSLTVFASIIWLTAGILMGNTGAKKQGSTADRVITIVSLAGVSVPMAWLSIYSLKTWTDTIPLFPAGGYESISEGGIFGWMYHILLPAATLSVVFAGVYARMARSNIRQALNEEHVKTAIAKGLPRRHIHLHHVLRTGLIPIIVLFGLDLAGLMGGAIFTESIFGLPGLGSVLMNGIGTFDFTLLTVGALIGATFVVIMNIVVDVVQAIADPRIRLA